MLVYKKTLFNNGVIYKMYNKRITIAKTPGNTITFWITRLLKHNEQYNPKYVKIKKGKRIAELAICIEKESVQPIIDGLIHCLKI
jgi:hypothetical protein